MSLNQPRIFVNIAAYRDRDCPNTIRDLFEKARFPDRITIGLCWQFLSPDDDDCQPLSVRPEQCRVIAVEVAKAQGVCWARHQVQSLHADEEFCLQIDSHMRFVENWDEKMLAMLAACPSDKPILTNYPAAFVPPDHIESHVVSVIYAAGFDRHGMVAQNSVGHAPEVMGDEPQPAAFCAGGFIFGDCRWIKEVPYDPYLYFLGEETSLAVRLYTHGWDLFTPTDVLLYHDYTNRPDRPRHWIDRPDWTQLNNRSYQRVRHLLGVAHSLDPEVVIEFDRYGLGDQRSLEDYQSFAEIDFKALTIKGKTTEQIEAEAPVETRRAKMAEIFGTIWRDNVWGDPVSRSGAGSTLQATVGLRSNLVELFHFLGIRSLVDAGCGDFTWMSEISAMFSEYRGFDVVADLIAALESRFAARPGHYFAVRNIAIDPLPAADAILARDVMTHLTHAESLNVLARIKASGSRYLIATTHMLGENKPIHMGDWHPIDLMAPPFGLPRPYLTVIEQAGAPKSLGVWRIDQL